MADNNTKVDQLHGNLPKHLNSKTNPNWKGLVEALGQSDQNIADLIAEVRKQFFIKTASRPYLDVLGANNKITRPRFVGMDDTSFKQYIPVMSYQPKQVKLIIDQLLDVFFFKESTTAFITSQSAEPYNIIDGWELLWLVDGQYTERVQFNSADFTNINAASADEVVSVINRQVKNSYAIAYYDSITKKTYVRIFTNTIGSKGAIQIQGGRANIALRLNGFNDNAGNGSNTVWSVTKVGEETEFQWVSGTNPNINNVQVGDIVIIDINGNIGSFPITYIDLVNNSFKFNNLFSTVGGFTQTTDRQVKFFTPNKYTAYIKNDRALTWEVSPGEIIVETPNTPPVVRRSLKGSAHVNGAVGLMSNRNSDTSLTVDNAYLFPKSGTFYLESVNEIKSRILTYTENTIVSKKYNSRLISGLQKYTYSSRVDLATTGDIVEGSTQITNLASIVNLAVGQQIDMDGVPPYAVVVSILGNSVDISEPATKSGNSVSVEFLGTNLTGISPNLPVLADLNEFNISSLTRSSNVVSVVTSTNHNYKVGEIAIISGCSSSFNGSFVITAASGATFQYYQIGINETAATLGQSRVERIGLSNTGSKVIVVNAISKDVSRIAGSYVWDTAAPFTLSSDMGTTNEKIQAGKIKKLLNIGANTLPEDGGSVIFSYGHDNQEGPVKYMYKPTSTTMALDPSYMFKHTHDIGAPIVRVSKSGPHIMSTDGSEYAPYLTDPSQARAVFQDLVKSVKSAGIFVNFLVRYPEQLYATLDVYNSGKDPG